MHSVTYRQTDGQTDANSQSYCVSVQSAKNPFSWKVGNVQGTKSPTTQIEYALRNVGRIVNNSPNEAA